MINRNISLAIVFLCTLCIITIYIRRKSNNTPVPLQTHCRPSLPRTCLQSYDANTLHKSLFHMSMVQFKVPDTLNHWVKNKNGFEIGAPSQSTWGSLGLYDAAATIDSTNFAANTLWESEIKEGSPFVWKNQAKGKHYIRDGVDLNSVPNEFYDFVCASDVLEHIANPFKALLEWLRIMRPGGLLIIIVPFKNVIFDHKRDIVQREHLINDYHNKTTEADLSHLNDIFRLHDIQRDYAAGNIEAFKARSQKKFEQRALH